jgi:hypothetical protein
MTVCIAAISDGGKKIVVAADRMFTAPPPVNLEFETAEKKIEALSPSCVALLSGNSAFGTEIMQGALATLQGAQQPQVLFAADAIKNSYVNVRARKVRESVIVPNLGPDYLRAEQLGTSLPAYLKDQGGLYMQLVGGMNGFNIGADIIVAGVDNRGAKLAVIGHPGTIAWLDKLGYAAIGSGGNHALMRLALGAHTRDSPLVDTLYRVYDAKRASEVAPGVGQATDIAIVYDDRTEQASPELLSALMKIFEESGGKQPASLDRVRSAIEGGGDRDDAR